MLKMADVPAGRREDFNEAETVTGDIIVPGGVLLGVGDEESATDVLNIERREAVGDFLGFERLFSKAHALEVGVIDFNSRGTEIGNVEKFVAVDFAGGCAFVDGAVRGAVIGVVNDEYGILSAIPAGDRSVFRGKDEVSGFAGSNQKVREAAIINDACGSRLGSRRRASRRRNSDDEGTTLSRWRIGIAVAIVQRGGTGIVVGNPPRAAARGASQSPRVFQIGVRRIWSGNRGQIRNEVRLFIMLRTCENGEQ